MDAKKLFLARCQQMTDLLKSHDEVELLDLAGILRRLIADQTSLVAQANTNKVKFRFRVGVLRDLTGLPAPLIHSLEDGIDPDTARPHIQVVELTIDQFLKHVVMKLSQQTYTIKDAITFAANVAGGIHLDPKPTNPKHVAMKAFEERFGIGGLPLGIRQLRAIARVTLRALEPVIADITNSPSPSQPDGA